MTNRYISVLPNNRLTTRGNNGFLDGVPAFYQGKNESLTYTIDFKRWLASGETISSSTVTTSGATVSNKTDYSNYITFNVSSASSNGEISVLISTSAGQQKRASFVFFGE